MIVKHRCKALLPLDGASDLNSQSQSGIRSQRRIAVSDREEKNCPLSMKPKPTAIGKMSIFVVNLRVNK